MTLWRRALTDRRKKQRVQAIGMFNLYPPLEGYGIKTCCLNVWSAFTCLFPEIQISGRGGNLTLNSILETSTAGSLHLCLDKSVGETPAPEAAPNILPTEDPATVLDVSGPSPGFLQAALRHEESCKE